MIEQQQTRHSLTVLMFCYVVLAVLYLIVIPPWQGVDEPTHVEQILIVKKHGPFGSIPLPRRDAVIQKEIIASLDSGNFWNYVGVQRPSQLPDSFVSTPFIRSVATQRQKSLAYYRVAALYLTFFPKSNLLEQVYHLRFLSLILSFIGVFSIVTLGRKIFKDNQGLVFLCSAACLFHPQFIISSVAISNESLFIPLYLSFLAALFSRSAGRRVLLYYLTCIFIGILCILTDRMGLMTLPIFLFHNRSDFIGIVKSSIFINVFLGFCCLFLLSPLITWHFPLLVHRLIDFGAQYYLRLPFAQPFGTAELFDFSIFLSAYMRSFFCSLGWMRFSYSDSIIEVIRIFFAAGSIGIIVVCFMRSSTHFRNEFECDRQAVLTLLLNVFLLLGISIYSYYFRGFYAQGRFLLPLVWPLVSLPMVGLVVLMRVLYIPSRLALTLATGALLFLQIVTILTVLFPAFILM